jgi:alpha-N-arabinofuranosidase
MTSIQVDPRRRLGRVDRRIFGGFVEHLGRCIYGGIYEEGSPLSDDRGFRRDVLALAEELRVSVLRWPGGNFVSNYHWIDGIGDKQSRPVRSEIAWGGTETNRFGTDEYIEYCRAIGAEPYICLNMGTGTLEEALAWIEYCNSTRPTYWSDRRRSNGYEAPHGVKWWGLGNEVYGKWQVGSRSASEYVAEATRWARAIKLLDPEAKLVSCGENGWSNWDRDVIDGLAGVVDLHSIHIYTGSDDYWATVLGPHISERAISAASAMLKRAAYTQKLQRAPRLVYDEWNVWFREMTGALEERYAFQDALAVGTFLNIFVRNCEWVAMANLAQLVNAIAPIVTTPETAVVQPIYYPVLLHAQGHLSEAVDTYVHGPTVEAPAPWLSRWPHQVSDLGPFTVVDAAATIDTDMTALALTLVNRSEQDEAVEVDLLAARFAGAARIRCVTSSDAPSPVPGVASATVTDGSESASGGRIGLTLPAKSFTLIEAALED